MLTQCPECDQPVSDKAIICPHCGFPLKKSNSATRPNKPKRLPNGFGQISKLTNKKLRKPYRAMVTIGKTDIGRPIVKLLQPEAYFETYNDAYTALLKYNQNPYSLSATILMEDLYERWLEHYKKSTPSQSSLRTVYAAWAYCESLYKIPLCELRARNIKYCMEEGTVKIKGIVKTASPIMKGKIKTLFNQILDYAVEYEIIDRNVARTFTISKADLETAEENQKHHIPYTDEEIAKLWDNLYKYPSIDMILIQCYTGWRPKELEILEKTAITDHFMKGGVKTKAGKDRIVPIHPRIQPLIQKYLDQIQANTTPYLFSTKPNKTYFPFTHNRYKTDLQNIINCLSLNPDHRPHDGRAHFITQAKKYNVDEYAIKYIVGHAISDITEGTYTTRSPEWLYQEIQKIP